MSPVYLNPSPVQPSNSSFPFLEMKDGYPANTTTSQLQLTQASSFMIPHYPSAVVAGSTTSYHHNISQDLFISKQQREKDDHDQLKFINFQAESSSLSSNPADRLVSPPSMSWSTPNHGTTDQAAAQEINHNNKDVEDGMEISYGGASADVTQSEDRGSGEVVDDGAAAAFGSNSSSSSNRSPSSKWKPTKVRMMTSTTSTKPSSTVVRIRHRFGHRVQHENNNNSNVRQCSDCHTTTTPLWRSGPQGPKTLCNACGIRQRKARQAMAAAAAAAAASAGGSSTINTNNTIHVGFSSKTNNNHKAHHKERAATAAGSSSDHYKGGNHHHLLPYKKRGKPVAHKQNQQQQQLSFEDFALSLTSSLGSTSTSRGSFPRDEEEGAILLMALSCGLA